MSITYISYASIGTFVPKRLLVKSAKIPSCNHEDIARKGKFCSECGIKVELVDDVDDSLYQNIDDIVSYYELKSITIYDNPKYNGVIIGHRLFVSDYGDTNLTVSDLPDINDLSKRISKFFKQYNIDTPITIKLYNNLYVS